MFWLSHVAIPDHCPPPSSLPVVDIQEILNGTARFCQYCEVVILSDGSSITKAKSDLPVVRDADQLADELHFCGQPCFSQFCSSQLTPAAAAERRAAAVVGHTGRDMFTNGDDVSLLGC